MSKRELKNLFRLSHRVSVYVPTKQQTGEAVKDGWTDKTAVLLSSLFGGATASDAIGFWVLQSGQLQAENVKLVFSFAQDLTDDAIDKVYRHCLDMRQELNQQAVSLEIDGELYLI